MIDNPAAVAQLMELMQAQLRIAAFPSKGVVRALRRGGVTASVDHALAIRRVFYLGDEGGISMRCDTQSGYEEGIPRLADTSARCCGSPLFRPIRAYQLERVRRTAAAGP